MHPESSETFPPGTPSKLGKEAPKESPKGEHERRLLGEQTPGARSPAQSGDRTLNLQVSFQHNLSKWEKRKVRLGDFGFLFTFL